MSASMKKEISCRVTRTLLMFVREANNGSLGDLLDGVDLSEKYLLNPHNWVSHAFLQTLYDRMIDILGDEDAIYKMTLASERFGSLGLRDRIVRLTANPKFIYAQAPKYSKLLKRNGDVYILIGLNFFSISSMYLQDASICVISSYYHFQNPQ